MRYETIGLGSDVIRFPIEARAKPSLDRLSDVAPDMREVELVAEAFGFDAPDPEERDKADRAMAENSFEDRLAGRSHASPRCAGRYAEALCRSCGRGEARQAALHSDEAGEKLTTAQIEGGHWLQPLETAANGWAVAAARIQIDAHEAAQAAHGGAGDRLR